jgi:hypothetical protein
VGTVVVAVAGRRAVPIVTVPVIVGVPIPVIVTGGVTIIGGIVMVPVIVGVPIPVIVTGGVTIIGGIVTVPVIVDVPIPVIVTGGVTIIGGGAIGGMPRPDPGNMTVGAGRATGWARG